MIGNFKRLALVSVSALAVNAQTSSNTAALPTSTGAFDSCISGCLTNATSSAPGGCTSFTNISCVCTSTVFQTAAAQCLKANCSATDQATALGLQSQQCKAFSNSSSSGSASSTGTSPASAATSKGAATGNNHLGYGELVGAAVAVVGVIVGGGLVF